MNETTPLIFSYSLNPSGKWEEVQAEAYSNADKAQLLWTHIDCSRDDSLAWLADFADLDATTSDSLVDQGTRPRISMMKEGLMVILRGVNCNPGQDPEDMVAIRMLFCENRIYTARNRKVMAIEDIKTDIDRGKGPSSEGDFLVMVAERIADRMGDIIQELEESVDELEADDIETSHSETSVKIADIRRTSILLRRYIAPQRDVLHRILNERVAWIKEEDRLRLKEVAERTARFVEDIDSMKERANIILEVINNQLSNKMNKAVYTLSIITAIFLPLGLLTGLLGINVGGIPGSEYKGSFAIVSIVILAIAAGLVLWFKKIKWL